MSCPDWQAIAVARAADPLADPPGFDAARSHLAQCEDCRRSAAAADPLLLFASLGRPDRAVERASDRANDHDNAAMTASVLAMVRASRVDAGETPASRRGARAARLSGLAAGLLVASLLTLSGTPGRAPSPSPSVTSPDAPLSVAAEISTPDLLALERLFEAAEPAAVPVMEEIDRPDARVYDLSHAELAVVMIVDASLDV